jgi:drug/metabolite transporter (DMT)-like permease
MNWLLLVALASLWGSGFAVVKLAVATMAPEWVMAIRLAIAGVVLCVVVYVSGRRLPLALPAWGWFTAIAIIGNNLPYFLISWGMVHIAAGPAGILMSVMPLVAVVLAHFVLPDEPLSAPKAGGFILGFAGVAVLIGPEHLLGIEPRGMPFWGQLAAVGGAVCYAVTGLVGRRMPPQGVLETAAASSAVGGVLGLITAVLMNPAGLTQASAESFMWVLALGLFPTALASLIYFRLLKAAGASFVSYCNYLIPVVALLVGAAFLGEAFRVSAVIGLVLILSGIAVSRSTMSFRGLPRR